MKSFRDEMFSGLSERGAIPVEKIVEACKKLGHTEEQIRAGLKKLEARG